jgi:UDP:flavonoid glycosyltransferase YjiC (YdhE family)
VRGSAPTSLRLLLAAFGDAGHVYPAIALGRALAARGHEVVLETWEERRDAVEGAGLGFTAAEEYRMFPPPDPDSADGNHAAEAARALLPLLEEMRPHVVVSDILTLAPALAAERAGVPLATLIPHIYPVVEPGLPFFAIGLAPPRTPLGRGAWRAGRRALEVGLEHGRRDLNCQRERLGLAPIDRFHGGISTELALVATFPQLEYPRRWPPGVHVVGPLMWEPPFGEVPGPPGDRPLVLVAPSTAQDPDHRLLRAALAGLAGEPIRVLATWNRRPVSGRLATAPNTRLVEWVSYSKTMPSCALVICHAGHGTMARALASGCPVLAVPHRGDMAENAARADWARVGVRLPWRLLRPAALRLAVRRALSEPPLAARARELAAWAVANDGAARAADLVEGLALGLRQSSGRDRTYAISSGDSPSTRSIGSPMQLHSSTTARSSVTSSGRQTAP